MRKTPLSYPLEKKLLYLFVVLLELSRKFNNCQCLTSLKKSTYFLAMRESYLFEPMRFEVFFLHSFTKLQSIMKITLDSSQEDIQKELKKVQAQLEKAQKDLTTDSTNLPWSQIRERSSAIADIRNRVGYLKSLVR